jgi:hypothetical protein
MIAKIPGAPERAVAWRNYDAAVVRAQALAWCLTSLTGRLLTAHKEVAARRVSDADCMMYAPTERLSRAQSAPQAISACQSYETTIVRTGLLEVLRELEQEGRLKPYLADDVVGLRDRVEGVRDALAGASLGLAESHPLGLGRRKDSQGDPPTDPQLAL